MEYKKMRSLISENAESWMQEERVPGCALCIIHDGEIDYLKCIGYADKKTKRPVTEDTIFQLGSISKSVTCWAIMKLVEQQILELDEPISSYLNGWSLPFSQYDKEKITIKHLLSHMGGVDVKSYLGVRDRKNFYSTMESLTGERYKYTKVRIVREPGETYLYSGGGYTILQHIIESVTKMPFERYIEQEVLQKLGIRGYYRIHPEYANLQAHPYGAFCESQPIYCFPEMAAAGLHMSLRDLIKFVAAHLKFDNEVLGQESMSLMFKKVKINILYGLGYFVRNTQSKHYIISMGRNRGYFSRFDIFHHDGNAFIILTNSINGSNLSNRLLVPWYKYHLNNTEPNRESLFLNNTNKLVAFLQERIFLLKHMI
ncbi:serine hydrolase domain-containing protein [Heyndrickxia sporothermodurans]|uniref:D-alanyl-D-alanine carboxypeptidase n=1 Tax=Heyndrickxia sporothermodurans TaxID=46224 RepID=A0A150L958_9BACI|nr:serine hydrolase domain-containing protein [Heyndrickxia sporothermodurans]KYD08559.1 D-alanyl-D-alanine carboxypeptidase [Heyndrickxia sporothermodurans]